MVDIVRHLRKVALTLDAAVSVLNCVTHDLGSHNFLHDLTFTLASTNYGLLECSELLDVSVKDGTAQTEEILLTLKAPGRRGWC